MRTTRRAWVWAWTALALVVWCSAPAPGQVTTGPPATGAAQSPLTRDVNGAGHMLTNLSAVSAGTITNTAVLGAATLGTDANGKVILGAAPGISMAQAMVAISSNSPCWFNATNYSLVGDGVTDNTLAFQGLLNIVATNSLGANTNGVIWFPPGRYLFGSNVYTPRGAFVIQGSGAGAISGVPQSPATYFDIRATKDMAWLMGTNIGSLVWQNIYTSSILSASTNSQFYFVNCNPQMDHDVLCSGVSNVALIVLSTNVDQTSGMYGGYLTHSQLQLQGTNIGVWLLTNANDFELSFLYVKLFGKSPEWCRIDGYQNDVSHFRVEVSNQGTNLFLVNGNDNVISFGFATDASSLTSVAWFNGRGNSWLWMKEDSTTAGLANAFQGAQEINNTYADLSYGFYHQWNGLQYSLAQSSGWMFNNTWNAVVVSNNTVNVGWVTASAGLSVTNGITNASLTATAYLATDANGKVIAAATPDASGAGTTAAQNATNTVSAEARTNSMAFSLADYSWASGGGGVSTLILGGAHKATLPNANTTAGQILTVICGTSGTNSIQSAGGTIDGVAAATGVTNTAQYHAVSVVSDGTNYWLKPFFTAP